MNPIDLYNIEKSYSYKFRQQKVLNNISLNVHEGEVFGFVGPNGAGKSTLINLFMGFTKPDSGILQIHGMDPNDPASRRQVGFLPENPRFYENLTPIELLNFGGTSSGMTKSDIKKTVDILLDRLEILHVKKQSIHTFSKGMKQRLGLALAMIHHPATLILDEPMSGLDPIGRNLLKNIILDLKAAGCTIFFSSHILNDVETLCDRVGIIHQGTLLYCGTIDTFLNGSNSFESRFVEVIETAGKGLLK